MSCHQAIQWEIHESRMQNKLSIKIFNSHVVSPYKFITIQLYYANVEYKLQLNASVKFLNTISFFWIPKA